MKYYQILLFVVLVLLLGKGEGLTRKDYLKAKNLIRSYIKGQTTSIPEPHLNLIPGLVRLVFHDCSGRNCDGCINPNHPFNGRTVPVVNALEPLFNQVLPDGFSIKKVMSRADFWALGSIEATKIAVSLNNQRCGCPKKRKCMTKPLRLPFKFGRIDCPTSPFYNAPVEETPVLPSSFLDNKQTLDFFKVNFGFNAKESTFIMGGHSLGFSANTTQQPGVWEIGNSDGFGNRYFKNMVDKSLNWHQVNNPTPQGEGRWSWNGNNGAFGLDTDINLVRDISVNTVTGKASSFCGSKKSPTYKYVKKMTRRSYFSRNYARTFIKMISLGASNLCRPH
ncbi:putative ascorbate peroxidase [Lepeophtheirus salmonis]|uniref:putative ascorbate peroxidase n=1 Tax=Lepeophtheirus salmonis TaxID=72036 RepID=UPI001AE21C6A|nr:putative ascorbate peroxidase [Lepeophtheirus salmonis]